MDDEPKFLAARTFHQYLSQRQLCEFQVGYDMDAVITMFDIIRVRGSTYFGKIVDPHWGMEVGPRPGFWRFHVVLEGQTWVRLTDTSNQTNLKAGDFVIIPRGQAHVLSDQKDGPVSSHHDIPDMEPTLMPVLENRVVQSDETQLLCGYFRFDEGTPSTFLNHLPDLLVARSEGAGGSGYAREIVGIIQQELNNNETGSLIVLNRLTEIMFFCAVRQWLDSALMPDGVLAALADKHVQRSLTMIHTSPEKPWTVDELARVAGISRTSFSNRFRTATGFTPIEYLTYWRIELARRLLAESDLSLDDIAARVGYVDTNAFSRAFSRISGIAPGAFRGASRGQL